MSELQTPQRQSIRQLLLMTGSALGIIYSDIGTSPLYVLNGIWPAAGDVPSSEDVIGGGKQTIHFVLVSAILWTLTLVPLIKYCFIALRFGTDQGEGGVFALFIGLFPKHTPSDDDRELTKTVTASVSQTNVESSRLLAKSKWAFMIWSFFGTALILADGILTPAVSVVSAVGGIAVAKPSTINSVAPISIAFLVLVFSVQSFGTHKISIVFSPVIIVWLALLGVTGIINVVSYPGIWRAYDPSRAIMFFVRTKRFDALAGVLLCITGCEAMYANLGQFNAPSIRLGFYYAYVCLVLAYLGQGAKIIVDGPNVIPNIFYNSIPGGVNSGAYWLLWAFGLLATLIASQTLITASFSLVQQLISMQAFPRLRMKYTSATNKGQVYFPAVNYTLMIAVVAAVGGFGTATALTYAYGFAVSTVMFVTSTLMAFQIVYVKKQSWLLAVAFFLFFGFIDGLFWGASLRKVPKGAWFPLSIASALTILMTFYAWGRDLEERFDRSHTSRLHDILFRQHHTFPLDSASANKKSPQFEVTPIPACEEIEQQQGEGAGEDDLNIQVLNKQTESRDQPLLLDTKPPIGRDVVAVEEKLYLHVQEDFLALARVPTCAIFHKTSGSPRGVPHTFYSFLKGWPALPRVVIFASTRVLNIPHVDIEDRYLISKVRSFEGIYGVTIQVGYRDIQRAKLSDIIPRIIQLEQAFDPSTARVKALEIEEAARHSTQILPNYILLSKKASFKLWDYVRRTMIEELYARLRVMFPDNETSHQDREDETVQIGVVAYI